MAATPAHPTSVDQVNFFDPATQENWYPSYDLLREQAHVWQMPGTNTFVLTRYEDIHDVLRRTDVFMRGASESTPSAGASSVVKEIYATKGWPRASMLGSNPPQHKKYRDIADPFFTPAGLEKRRGLITKIVNELVDDFAHVGSCEFVTAFAVPLPVRVITIMMGFKLDDIPKLKKYRDIADPFFTPAGSEKRRGLITQIVNELVDDFVHDGSCEFVTAFAVPLPVRVITIMMGFKLDDIPKLKKYSEAWVLPFRGGLSHEEEVYAGETGVEFQHFIHATMQEKKANPDDSVISYLVNEARFDGVRPLEDHEIINIVDHLYIGGNETTTFALTSTMWLMLDTPGVYDSVRADPSRVKNLVEEGLRCESPTMGMVRNAIIDTEVGGVKIPKGSNLHLRYAAGNRDERMFACPARFDLDRTNSARHMAFSLGETHCTGAGLSRLEQNVAFDVLVKRLPNLRFTPNRNDFTHHPNVTLRAMKELHLSWDPS